jgi:bacillithiol synthase
VIEVVRRPLGGSPLVGDYLADRGDAGRFYATRFDRPEDFRDLAALAGSRFDATALGHAADLVRPVSPAAAERLERFRREGGVMVTTGQQAGLFGGPIYTVTKALSAARLADELEALLDVPVVPVFWVASDDHDWEEVRRQRVVDARGRMHVLELDAGGSGLPVAAIPLPPEVAELGDEVRKILGAMSPSLEEAIAAYRPGRGTAEAFRDFLHALLGSFDLCTIDAAEPALKRAALPVLRREIEHRTDHEEALRGRAGELAAAGYPVQVPVLERAANLFLVHEGRRQRLEESPRGWLAPVTSGRFSPEELLALLDAHPDRFSPNVLLRPVVEASVLPTIAYVGGPAEVAYLAQAAPLFYALGVAQPVAVPRISVELWPEEARAARSRLGISRDDLDRPLAEVTARLAERRLPTEAAAALSGLRSAVADGFVALMDAAPGGPSGGATGPLGASRNRILAELARAERRLRGAVRASDGDLLRDLSVLFGHLRPEGRPQERAVGILPYVATDGAALLDRIAGTMDFGLRPAAQPSVAAAPAD